MNGEERKEHAGVFGMTYLLAGGLVVMSDSGCDIGWGVCI